MPPQSRGHRKLGSYSQSTPNLAAINTLLPLPEGQYLPTPRLSPPHPPGPPSPSPPSVINASPDSSADEDGDASSAAEDPLILPATRASSTSAGAKPRQPELRRVTTQPPPPRPLYTHASRSQSYLGPHSPAAFAPPFYNRPPTPLPPSPSLTSLLRPPFSALPSRPATPDSSDTDATGATTTTSDAGNLAVSARRTAGPVPRASPKVPTYEYYGFVLYLGSSLAFLMYLLWSYLPTPFLHQLGIYYYPNRWWSLAVPSWLTMLVIYIYVALASYNTGRLTLKMGDVECIVDEKGEVAIVDGDGVIVRKERRSRITGRGEAAGAQQQKNKGGAHNRSRSPAAAAAMQAARRRTRAAAVGAEHSDAAAKELNWRNVWNEGTDAVMDVPLGGVCEILYGNGRDADPEDEEEGDDFGDGGGGDDDDEDEDNNGGGGGEELWEHDDRQRQPAESPGVEEDDVGGIAAAAARDASTGAGTGMSMADDDPGTRALDPGPGGAASKPVRT